MLFGFSYNAATALIGSGIAGFSWIAAISALNLSAQLAAGMVCGRGLALFVTIMFGAMTAGSVVWANWLGLRTSGHTLTAAAGALLAIPATWRWKLQTADGVDLSPSMHWPAPLATHDVKQDRGPVMVTVEYRIDPGEREKFLTALDRLAQERRRDGAYAWGVYQDTAVEGRMMETFFVELWLEHLRQHQRVTNADRVLQDTVQKFHLDGEPKVTHLITA